MLLYRYNLNYYTSVLFVCLFVLDLSPIHHHTAEKKRARSREQRREEQQPQEKEEREEVVRWRRVQHTSIPTTHQHVTKLVTTDPKFKQNGNI